MHTLTVTLKSAAGSKYYQSAPLDVPMLDQELYDAYDERVWKHRAHAMPNGHIFIPPSAFKNCLNSAPKYLGMKIPGRRGATYTRHIVSGILVVEPLILPVTLDTLEGERLFVPADGKPGGSRRVFRRFPFVPEWSGVVQFQVIDDILDEFVVRKHLEVAGQSVGIGAFRPENRGWSGRFVVVDSKWD